MTDNEKNYLEHFGVLGMRWGHRRGSSEKRSDRSSRKEKLGLIPRLMRKKENFRIGKAKGQSDKDFDKEYNAETRKINREIKAEKMAKAKKQAEKALAKVAKMDQRIAERKKFAQDEIDYDVTVTKHNAIKKGKNFNEAEYRKKLEKLYESDLKATPESVRREDRELGATLAVGAIAIIGSFVADAYLRRA